MGELGSEPSEGSRLPPGKTWAEGKEEEVLRRDSKRMLLSGPTTMVDDEGDVGAGSFLLP